MIPWAAISLATGIAFYFTLRFEPSVGLLAATALAAAVMAVEAVTARKRGRSLAFALYLLGAFAALGFARVGLQSRLAEAPILEKPFYVGEFGGRVTAVEPRIGGVRLTLEEVVMTNLAVTPERIRVTVRGGKREYEVGERIRGRGGFYPPPKPAAVGLADFSRSSWFRRLGAYGYSMGPPRVTETAHNPSPLETMRRGMARRIHQLEPTAEGAVAIALITGIRGGIPDHVVEQIRVSGLAHLLAISGLHLGLVMGGVFFFVRATLALFPSVALPYNIKKWAVFPSLAAGAFYLIFTGSTIPTLRSFIMAFLVLVAVLLERTAISIRLLATAAMIILLWSPQVLIQPGFQMSFAATGALVWLYRLRGSRNERRKTIVARLAAAVLALAAASTVAWVATAPFAAYHFHRLAIYSLPANLIAVPLTAFWVMPTGMVALLATPLGLDEPLWRLMTAGIAPIIATAETIAAMPSAVRQLMPMPTFSLLAFAFALTTLFLMNNRRAATLAAFLATAGAIFHLQQVKPTVVITPETVAFRNDDYWFAEKADRYLKPMLRPELGKLAPPGWSCDALGCVYEYQNYKFALSKDKKSLAKDCRLADVLLAPDFEVSESERRRRGCRKALIIDRRNLERDGAHSIFTEPALRLETVGKRQGKRPWRRYYR